MNIAIILMVILLMSCTVWLVNKAAIAAQDPKHSFSQLEFAVSAMALLCGSIAISYFAIAHIVMVPEPGVIQSSYSVFAQD